MTSFKTQMKKCVLCGQEQENRVLVSYNTFGQKICLDFQVLGGGYYELHLHKCSLCHYVNYDIEKLIKNLDHEIVLSKEYNDLVKGNASKLQLALYLFWKSKNYEDAGYCCLSLLSGCSYLYECQMFDFEIMQKIRQYKLWIEKDFEKALKDNPNDLMMKVILTDIKRRLRKFNDSSLLASKVLKQLDVEEGSEVKINQIKAVMQYQIKLCDNCDDKLHFLDEVSFCIYNIGEEIWHEDYGFGKIFSVDKNDNYIIGFDYHGQKTISPHDKKLHLPQFATDKKVSLNEFDSMKEISYILKQTGEDITYDKLLKKVFDKVLKENSLNWLNKLLEDNSNERS